MADCRRCSECIGQDHHFLEHAEEPTDDNDEGFAGYICKYCEVKADLCESCDGPVYPTTGATKCADCTAGRNDFEP
jgi:hypothetical protein